jgi:RHS repeat-associated protein
MRPRAGEKGCNQRLSFAAEKPQPRLHCSQQFSTVALTTSSGAIAERYTYSAYGAPTVCNASGTDIGTSTKDNRITYTGREWDDELVLYHFRARLYDAGVGRFLGRDPVSYFQSNYTMFAFLAVMEKSISFFRNPGLYNAFSSKPLSSVDPHGLFETIAGELIFYAKFENEVYWIRRGGIHGQECKTGSQDPSWKFQIDGCTGVPSDFQGFSFYNACANHDRCYQTCGADKDECDNSMLIDMMLECEGIRDWEVRLRCRATAWFYFQGIHYLAHPSFKQRQKEACLWGPCPFNFCFRYDVIAKDEKPCPFCGGRIIKR